MDGHNDLDALQVAVAPYHHRNDAAFDRALNDPGIPDVFWLALRYGEHRSLFVRRVSLALTDFASRSAERSTTWRTRVLRRPAEPEIERWLDRYAATVRRLDSSARIAGAQALFTVQLEVAGERLKPLTAEEKRMYEHYRDYRWLHTEVRARLIARMCRLAQDGVWFVDVSDAFENEAAQAYLDYTHLTSAGATVMAERLATIVERMVFSAQPRRTG
jgi:lysophospholipase L1-like esterase